MLGWPQPVYAHLPLLHGEDVSKPSGARARGTIPHPRVLHPAICLKRDAELPAPPLAVPRRRQETISTEQAIDGFNLESTGGAPPGRFKKPNNFNGF